MRKVRCKECGKSYDFDIDDFCPKCGAFNQPGWAERNAAMRVDGLNEQGHYGSFLHRELHAEDKVRRIKGLEQPPVQGLRKPGLEQKRRQEWNKYNGSNRLSGFITVIIFLVVVILLRAILLSFFMI